MLSLWNEFEERTVATLELLQAASTFDFKVRVGQTIRMCSYYIPNCI